MNEQDNNVTPYNGNNSAVTGNTDNKKGKINLPNKLTIFRILLVPAFMVFVLLPKNNVLPETWSRIFAAALFLIAALTDLLDGMIARKMNLITDFGKFMDAVADKFMVVGMMIAITASPYFESIRFLSVWATSIIFFRELAVTSMRLVANSSDGKVISANLVGKLKTFSQCVCVMTILLEKTVITNNLHTPEYLFSYITMAIMTLMTIYSGFIYFKSYWKYIDPTK